MSSAATSSAFAFFICSTAEEMSCSANFSKYAVRTLSPCVGITSSLASRQAGRVAASSGLVAAGAARRHKSQIGSIRILFSMRLPESGRCGCRQARAYHSEPSQFFATSRFLLPTNLPTKSHPRWDRIAIETPARNRPLRALDPDVLRALAVGLRFLGNVHSGLVAMVLDEKRLQIIFAVLAAVYQGVDVIELPLLAW